MAQCLVYFSKIIYIVIVRLACQGVALAKTEPGNPVVYTVCDY
jgi:hypothetical protein